MNFKTFKRFRKIFGRFAINHENKILDKADDIQYFRSLLEDEENENCEKQYAKMREEAQLKGDFAVISFDIKDSKKGYDIDFIHQLFDEYIGEIKALEDKWGIDILHKPAESSLPYTNGYFQFGDLYSIPIFYDPDLTIELFTYVFEKVKKRLGVDYKFHYTLLRYDTDYYFEGGLKYYLMDAVKDSETISKQKDDLI